MKKFNILADIHKFEFKFHNSELYYSIHKRILLRFSIAAILISIVLAAAASFIELRRIDSLVNGRASEVVFSFNDQIRNILDSTQLEHNGDLKNELKMLLIAGKYKHWMGQLVYSSIIDTQGKEIATELDTNYAEISVIKELTNSFKPQLPTNYSKIQRIEYIKSVPYIQLIFPLTNSNGEQVSFIKGIFAISKNAKNEVIERILRLVLGTICIVFLTTIILYPIILTLTKKLTYVTDDLIESNIETLRVVGSAIAKRDSDTDSHNYRVTIYSVILAEKVGLKPSLIRGLIKGAFLHDVGKIGVSDQILLKPGKLTNEEFGKMKLHINHGLDIVRRSEWLRDALDIVAFHHEKYSGAGYPHGIAGPAIPISARIFAIADVFDALTSIRPYKKPMSFEDSINILKEKRGSHFDPLHLDCFFSIAQSLYETYANCSDQKLHEKLDSIIREYFSKDYRANE